MQFKKEYRQLLLFLFILWLFLSAGLPCTTHGWDTTCWADWAFYIQTHGLRNAYGFPGLNYNPVVLYLLRFFCFFHTTPQETYLNIRHFRVIILLFDMATAALIGYYLLRKNMNPFVVVFLAISPVFLYNTYNWGQVDVIPSLFMLAAFICVFYKKPVLACIMILISLNTKLQAIAVLPVFGLIMLPEVFKRPSLLWKIPLAMVCTEILIIMPFLLAGQASRIWQVNLDSVGYFPRISMNAFNIWTLITDLNPDDLMQSNDSQIVHGLSYKTWGTIMYLASVVLAIIPVAATVFKDIRYRRPLKERSEELYLLAASAALISFFYFNTQMHERYTHPAMPFLALLALWRKEYVAFICFSIAYFLNMENVLKAIGFANYRMAYLHYQTAAVLFGLLLIYLLFRMYTIAFRSEPNSTSKPVESVVV